MAKNPNKIRAKRVASDYVIDIIMIVTIVLVLVLTLYPFLNCDFLERLQRYHPWWFDHLSA